MFFDLDPPQPFEPHTSSLIFLSYSLVFTYMLSFWTVLSKRALKQSLRVLDPLMFFKRIKKLASLLLHFKTFKKENAAKSFNDSFQGFPLNQPPRPFASAAPLPFPLILGLSLAPPMPPV